MKGYVSFAFAAASSLGKGTSMVTRLLSPPNVPKSRLRVYSHFGMSLSA